VAKRIPVFDTSATKVLFHRKRAEAEGMVASGVACELSRHPFEIRLAKPPASRAGEDLMRPDRSLSMGPKVMAGAAQGDAACISFLHAWRGPEVRNGVPEELWKQNVERSILFMPSAGELTNKPPRPKRKKAKTRLTRAQLLEGFANPANWVECTLEELETDILKELES
jgi:hypothetical protein